MSAAEKVVSGVSRTWYNQVVYQAPCLDRTSGQQCYEYPLFVTVEGGSAALDSIGPHVLKPILTADNQAEGTAYTAMINTTDCGMAYSALDGGTEFLAVPMVNVDIPSLFICPSSQP